jgi:hypothetical protein
MVMKFKKTIITGALSLMLAASASTAFASDYNEIEPNDDYSQTPQTLGQWDNVMGTIATSTDKDFYKLKASGNTLVYLRPPVGVDYDLIVYKYDSVSGDYNWFASSSNTGSTTELIRLGNLNSNDTYIVRVMSYGNYSSSQYQLSTEGY